MDINTLRIAVTVASLFLFLALVLHSWSRQREQAHHEAALLPFLDEPIGPAESARDHTPGARP